MSTYGFMVWYLVGHRDNLPLPLYASNEIDLYFTQVKGATSYSLILKRYVEPEITSSKQYSTLLALRRLNRLHYELSTKITSAVMIWQLFADFTMKFTLEARWIYVVTQTLVLSACCNALIREMDDPHVVKTAALRLSLCTLT
jgi:hypothetical protein